MPPSSNTGAKNTSLVPSENRALIDWLAWTVKEFDPHAAIASLGLSFLPFQASPGGGMGYRSTLRCGHITVFFDGAENMGCHFVMSGQGCREFEGRVKNSKNRTVAWYRLMHSLQAAGANITRIDLAVDTVDGSLPLENVEKSVRERRVQSRFREAMMYEKIALTDTEKPTGKTIYLGSSQGKIKIRFYDKMAERGLSPDLGSWVRAEVQCMAERAAAVVMHLCKGVEFGELVVSCLNTYYRPINAESVNKSHCSTQDWWSAWLTTTEKIRLTSAKAVKYVTDSMEYVKRQYGATFAMFKKYLGVAAFSDFMHDLVSTGRDRMSRKHTDMIEITNLSELLPPYHAF
ncbi:replication initiation factor domain-containing protein [Pelobacter propionicus]|uniref:Replication initiation factor n=1 Tax=Pelobacter propionicus (strain DSM 2379 / NBRC 103807 / OttBd1) TaxID=338966 RepID=A1APU8_PELPD|nr:replication initiation factor domain-containing protein [Pelobacter propionicus]ABK99368.1 replication initiation factor [Pelobacter propionicus DSM 2379]